MKTQPTSRLVREDHAYNFRLASDIKLTLFNHIFRQSSQKQMKPGFLLVLIISVFVFSPAKPKVQPADLVLRNANIYTVNPARPKAEAVSVRGDRIIYIGSNAGVQDY